MASHDEVETEPAPEGALTCQHCGGTWGGCVYDVDKIIAGLGDME